ILGGFSIELKSILDSIVYLDLTKDFNLSSAPIVNEAANKIPVRTSWGVAAVGGINKSTIFLVGGIMMNSNSNANNFDNLFYTYDVNTKVWDNPKATGIAPANRRESSAVVDVNGKIYIFGG